MRGIHQVIGSTTLIHFQARDKTGRGGFHTFLENRDQLASYLP